MLRGGVHTYMHSKPCDATLQTCSSVAVVLLWALEPARRHKLAQSPCWAPTSTTMA